MINDKKHLTAKTRSKPSVPMLHLANKGLLKGSMLDYGCGKGFDAEYYGMTPYDPYYCPSQDLDDNYDVITCNYVLNVVGQKEEKEIIKNISNLLKKDGTAYLTVRRDLNKDGFTSRGTYQRNVILDLPVIFSNQKLCIYRMEK